MKYSIEPDFRDLFRPLTPEEFEQAKANNLADPNHERIPPVIVWGDVVVDGHHTLKIRENLRINGKPPKIRYVKMDFPDRQAALAYAVQAQLGRRNLDPSQIAIALAKLPKAKPGRKAPPEETPKNAGETPKKNSRQLTRNSRDALAKEHGVSQATMTRADKVHEHGSTAVEKAVAAGDVSVSDAAAVADLPKKEQAAALRKVKSGAARTLKAAAKPKSQEAEPPKDGTGYPLPGTMLVAFETGERVRAAVRQIGKLIKEVTDLATPAEGIVPTPGTERIAVSAIHVARKDLKSAIETGLPHAVCPYCKGKGCKQCDSYGWIHKDRWNGIPEERRAR